MKGKSLDSLIYVNSARDLNMKDTPTNKNTKLLKRQRDHYKSFIWIYLS